MRVEFVGPFRRLPAQRRQDVPAVNHGVDRHGYASDGRDGREPVEVRDEGVDRGAGGDPGRPADERGHAQRRVPHVAPGAAVVGEQPVAVAFVPDAVVPHVEPVVRGEDHHGVPRQTEFLEGLHEPADVSVDGMHATEVLAEHPFRARRIQLGIVGLG